MTSMGCAELGTAVVVRCRRCGRTLRAESSIAAGYGPRCTARMTATLAVIGQLYSPAQIGAAAELISDGGLVVGPDGTCLATSSDGRSVYVIDPGAGACSCPVGVHGRRCYHLAAAQALVGPAVVVVPLAPSPVRGYSPNPTPGTQLETGGPRRSNAETVTDGSSEVECVRAAVQGPGRPARDERAAVTA